MEFVIGTYQSDALSHVFECMGKWKDSTENITPEMSEVLRLWGIIDSLRNENGCWCDPWGEAEHSGPCLEVQALFQSEPQS